MSVSFPWLVGTWLGAALLITIFYLVREQRPRVFVPFLELFAGPLEQARRESFRGWLRRPGSLLIQLLLLSLIGSALTECSRRLSPKGETLVLVIDTSASMGIRAPSKDPARSSGAAASKEIPLERAKARARAWLESLGPTGEIAILEMSALPKVVLGKTADSEAALRALDRLEVKASTANWSRTLELARSIPAPDVKRIVVLSDADREIDPGLSASVTFDRVERARLEENIGVRSFAARRSPSGAGQFEATYELSLQGPRVARALVEVERLDASGVPGGVVDAREISLAPGASYRGAFRELRGVERALRLKVRLLSPEPEAFLVDNVAFAVLPEERLVRVLCVGPESLYLKAALLSLVRAQITEISASTYPLRTSNGSPELFDLTIFRGEAPARVRETGPAIYLGATGAHQPVSLGGPLKMFGFDESQREASVFRHFDPYETLVLRGWSLLPEAQDRVLGKSGGQPILVRGERSEGAFLSLGFQPEASDLVLRPGFPLFIRGAVEELLGSQEEEWVPSLELGRPLRVELPEGGGPFVDVRGPLEGADAVTRRALVRADALELEFEEPGIYELSERSGSRRVLAVNFGAGEATELEKQTAPRHDPPLVVIPTNASWWKWALGLSFALAFFEFAAFHRRWTA